MSFYQIQLHVEERLQVDEKTQLHRGKHGIHACITDGPIVARITRKYRHRDFIRAYQLNKDSYGAFLLLSPRFWKLLEEIKATGYDLYKADTKLIYEHVPADTDYRQMVVTGWGGISKGIHRVQSQRGEHCYSLPDDPKDFFVRKQWDGSDFFHVWPAAGFFVTQRIAELVEAERIKGIHLRDIEDVSFTPVDEAVGFIGHPLWKYFPEERAREIGEPLGIYWWPEE